MPAMGEFDRITIDPAVMVGQPVVKGTRLPVYMIVEALAAGDTKDELLAAYPYLALEDIDQALRFAARMSHLGLEVA